MGEEWTEMMLHFVCSGNTCRSPMAEHLGRALGARTASSGLWADPGREMTAEARQALIDLGLGPGPHGSRRPTPRLIAEADWTLVMTRAHRDELLKAEPWAGPWVRTLAEWGGEEGDIDDPVGGGPAVYAATARRIRELIRAGLERNEPVPSFAWAAGSDHAGVDLKRALLEGLRGSAVDVGTDAYVSCDYPDFAEAVGALVASGKADRGLLVCGSGIGMSIAANKVPGVRAAVAWDGTSGRLAREHNDANVICFGARLVGPEVAKDALAAYAEASFGGGRHARRIAKIRALEGEETP